MPDELDQKVPGGAETAPGAGAEHERLNSALAGPAVVGALLAGLLVAARRKEDAQQARRPWWKPEPPAETSFQGASSAGATPPHEVTDLDAGLVAKWLAGLTLTGLVIHAALWGVFRLWSEGQPRELIPAALTGTRVPPPEPRLLPEPVRNGSGGGLTLRTWDEAVAEQRARETGALAALDLYDRHAGLPQLPPTAAGDVQRLERPAPVAGTPNRADPFPQGMPSYSSGGTALEDQRPR